MNAKKLVLNDHMRQEIYLTNCLNLWKRKYWMKLKLLILFLDIFLGQQLFLHFLITNIP